MSNSKNYISLLVAISCLLSYLNMEAQVIDTLPPEETTVLPSEQLEVIKLFQARLEDAKKINIQPESPKARKLETFTYEVDIRPLELEYLEPTIKPIAMLGEEKPEKFNGYVNVGLGNLNALNVGLGYNYLSRRETEINFLGDYLTLENENDSFQKFQKINAGLRINHNVGNLLAIGVETEYDRKDINFFGSPIDTIGSLNGEPKRIISDFGFGLHAFNQESNVYNLSYHLGLDYGNFQLANEGLAENNFIAGLELSKGINENLDISIGLIADISSISDTSTISYNNYFITPKINYSKNNMNFSAGVNFAFDKNQSYYLPDVMISFSPVDYSFIPYVFWKGEIQKNNLSSLFKVNPFLGKSIVPNLENTVINQYGLGIKGAIKTLNYNVSGSYGQTDNLILFNSFLTQENLRQFNILKDTADVFRVSAGINYKVNNSFNVNSDFSFYNYSLNTNTQAWHLPTYKIDIGINYYALNKKLQLSPNIFLRDGVFVLNDDNETDELIPLVDFNIQAKYHFTERFHAYANVNNLLTSEYQLWDNYSQFGITFLGGIKWIF